MGRRLRPHVQGHILRFDALRRAPWSDASGVRLLLLVLVVEGIIGPRLGFLRWAALPVPPRWAFLPLLVAIVLLLAVSFARVTPAQLGIRSWRRWTMSEKSYFVQVLIIASVVFGAFVHEPLRRLIDAPSLWPYALGVLTTSLLWGFYQELIYRGVLQSELARRWGPLAGILVANLLYTFGPLHWYHLARGWTSGAAAMMASIFAIGLFFALVFHRSGNLVMVGIFHGLGNWYTTGVPELTQSVS